MTEKSEVSNRFVGVKEIAEIFALSVPHVRDRIVKRADFPKAYRIGAARRWNLPEVFEWVESRHEHQ